MPWWLGFSFWAYHCGVVGLSSSSYKKSCLATITAYNQIPQINVTSNGVLYALWLNYNWQGMHVRVVCNGIWSLGVCVLLSLTNTKASFSLVQNKLCFLWILPIWRSRLFKYWKNKCTCYDRMIGDDEMRGSNRELSVLQWIVLCTSPLPWKDRLV